MMEGDKEGRDDKRSGGWLEQSTNQHLIEKV